MTFTAQYDDVFFVPQIVAIIISMLEFRLFINAACVACTNNFQVN